MSWIENVGFVLCTIGLPLVVMEGVAVVRSGVVVVVVVVVAV